MPTTDEKILDTVKPVVNIPTSLDVFDDQLLIFINSAVFTLSTLGVGPADDLLSVTKDTQWSAFPETRVPQDVLKRYLGISVRLDFDPPQNSATLTAFQATKRELEFRMQVMEEEVKDFGRPAAP